MRWGIKKHNSYSESHIHTVRSGLSLLTQTTITQDRQGPFVQSVVSLTSSLRVISLTVLADSIYNILIFFAEKNVSSFCTAKATHIFSAKNCCIICISLDVNFNKSLTNDIVSSEQLGLDVLGKYFSCFSVETYDKVL